MNTSKIFNAAIYLRLSRDDDDKDKESSSITSQREYLLKYLKDNNYNFIDEYIDDGYSGTNFNRPDFIRLTRDIESKKINMIVVKDLSRLGRNNGKMSYYLDEYFPIKDIRLIAVNNSYDSYIDNVAKEMAWVTNGFNEMYAQDISKKVRTNLRTKKLKGEFTGFKAPYGYIRDINDKHKLKIDNEASVIVKRIFELASVGKSSKQIADILSNELIPTPSVYASLNRGIKSTAFKLWCSRTIDEMLTNETYIGNLTQGRRKRISYKVKKEVRLPKDDWIIVNGTHEPIITKEKFLQVQYIQGLNNKSKIDSNIKLLTGFLVCRECNHAIGITRSKDKKRNYCACTYYRKYSKHKVCTPHTLNYEALEVNVLNKIKELFDNYINSSSLEDKLKNLKIKKSNIDEIQSKIISIQQNIHVINDSIDIAYIDKNKKIIDLNRYKSVTNKLNDELVKEQQALKQLEKELYILNQKAGQSVDYKELVREFLSLKNIDRKILSSIIDKIYISENKEIDIKLRIRIN